MNVKFGPKYDYYDYICCYFTFAVFFVHIFIPSYSQICIINVHELYLPALSFVKDSEKDEYLVTINL